MQPGDIAVTFGVGLAVVLVLGAFHKELVFGAFDPGGAAAAGYRTSAVDVLVLGVLAVTVVTSIPAVGTILVVALVVTPALTARLWVDRVGPMMILAAALGAAAGVVGTAVSAQWGVAGGAATALERDGVPPCSAQREAFVALGHDLLALLAYGGEADERHEHPRLAGHVGAEVPGVARREQRHRRRSR